MTAKQFPNVLATFAATLVSTFFLRYYARYYVSLCFYKLDG